MRHVTTGLGIVLACLAGCGGLELNPLVNEPRTVRLEQDRSKTLTVVHEMVWSDKSHATREIRFPAGTYSLEAEDADYWYMRSPAPLVLREFKKGMQTESRNIRGGIAIGKYTTRSVPAAGYIDGQESSRILIWKLGKDFLSREGKDWRKSS
ncbi:MAG: hypothetical protein ABSG30_16150 [Steroidobacteraceae bacterium]